MDTHPVEKRGTRILFFCEWEEDSEAKVQRNYVKDDRDKSLSKGQHRS